MAYFLTGTVAQASLKKRNGMRWSDVKDAGQDPAPLGPDVQSSVLENRLASRAPWATILPRCASEAA